MVAGTLAQRRPDESGPSRAAAAGQIRDSAGQALSVSMTRYDLGHEGLTANRLQTLPVIIFLCAITVYPQAARKEIAVTIDDLPLNGPRFELTRLQTMTSKLLAGI